MGRFLVVHFTEEDSMEVVPETWEDDGFCYWPSVSGPGKLNKMVRDGIPASEDWSKYKVRVMYSSGSYEKACRKLKIADETSDLGTTDQSEGESSRKFSRSTGCIEQPTLNEEESLVNITNVSCSPFSLNTPTVTTSIPSRRFTPVEKYSGVQHKIIKILEDVKQEQREQTLILKQLLNKRDVKSLPVGCPNFPCSTPRQLEDFNSYLETEENFSQICTYFGSIGGVNAKDIMRRILQSLMTNHLSTLYNWKGTRGVKLGFSQFSNIIKLISAALRLHPTHHLATDHEIEECIKKWLMHAKDRSGGRSARAKK